MKPAVKWGIAAASGIAIAIALKKMSEENEENADNTQLALKQLAESSQQQTKNTFFVADTYIKNGNIIDLIINLINSGYNAGVIFAAEDEQKLLPGGTGNAFAIYYATCPSLTNYVTLVAYNILGYATFRSLFSRKNIPSSLTWK